MQPKRAEVSLRCSSIVLQGITMLLPKRAIEQFVLPETKIN